MKPIKIEQRPLTPKEENQINLGFDALSIEEGLEIESTDQISFVALEEEKLIGGAKGLAHKNGDAYSGWFHLTDLFVEKEYRSLGLGSKLLIALEKYVITIGVKHIWLWTSGAEALKFYQRQGYESFAEMENWYSDGSSRVGLKKNL